MGKDRAPVGFSIGLKSIFQCEAKLTGKEKRKQKIVFLFDIFRFACHRWLDKNEDDGQIELNLTPSDVTRKQSGKNTRNHLDCLLKNRIYFSYSV